MSKKIVLECVSSVADGEKQYLSELRLVGGPGTVQVTLDAPCVPGKLYSLMLYGHFPTYRHGEGRCVTDLDRLAVTQILHGISLEEELKEQAARER